MKKTAASIFIAMFILLLLLVNAEGAEKNVYNLRLFTDNQLLNNPNNQESYWFNIRPGVKMAGNNFLELYYSCSGVLLNDQSYLTVSVNGIPVASRRLSGQKNGITPWRVTIPGDLVYEGVNELRINSLHRTTEGHCKDIDNAANWLVLHKDTVLHLETLYSKDLRINNYPLPFLDYLDNQPVKCTFYLPENPTREEISTLLQMASDWGAREQYKQLPLTVKLGSPVKDGGNKIFIGGPGSWPGLYGTEIPGGSGLLSLVKPDAGGKGYSLYVVGDGPGGLQKAWEMLSQPKALAQLDVPLSIIDERPEITSGIVKVGRPRTYTLADLGYQDINMPGAFHQRTSVVIKRPLRRKIGSSSYIEAHFRHSEALNGKNSALTVYINGRPLASTALDASNEKNGVLRVNIPQDELNKPEWMVEFAFYHDIGEVDCSKRYDEVAWSVVEKETLVYLAEGEIEDHPTLACFPYLGYLDGQTAYSPTMWLAASPGQQELTLAAIIAARVGQKNMGRINWQLVQGDSPEEDRLKNGPVIMIGRLRDGMFAGLKGILPVCPDGRGGYQIAGNLGIAPQSLEGATVIEAADSPWGRKNQIYAVICSDDASFEMAGRVMTSIGRLEQNNPQVDIVSRSGNVLNFSIPESQGTQGIFDRIKDFFKGRQYQNSLLTYALIVGLAVLGVGVTLFIAWRRSR